MNWTWQNRRRLPPHLKKWNCIFFYIWNKCFCFRVEMCDTYNHMNFMYTFNTPTYSRLRNSDCYRQDAARCLQTRLDRDWPQTLSCVNCPCRSGEVCPWLFDVFWVSVVILACVLTDQITLETTEIHWAHHWSIICPCVMILTGLKENMCVHGSSSRL